VDLAKELQESLLGQIFGFDGVASHAQAESVDAAAVKLIDGFEGGRVALLSQANGFFERGSIRLQGLSRLRGRCRQWLRGQGAHARACLPCE